jgi:hypothetical protein
LPGNAEGIPIRTKDAAVAGRRFNRHVAVGAAVENETKIGRDFQFLTKAAKGAGKIGTANDVVCHNDILYI